MKFYHRSTLSVANTWSNVYQVILEKTQDCSGDVYISISFDKTTDATGRYVANIIFWKLEKKAFENLPPKLRAARIPQRQNVNCFHQSRTKLLSQNCVKCSKLCSPWQMLWLHVYQQMAIFQTLPTES